MYGPVLLASRGISSGKEESQHLLQQDVEGQQGADGGACTSQKEQSTQSAKLVETISGAIPITVIAWPVVVACLFPVADLSSDTFQALPAYWNNGLIESFEVQVGAIVIGALLSYVKFLYDIGIWTKLSRCPIWLRAMFISSGFAAFPLAPFFVMGEAVYGWSLGEEQMIQEAKEAADIVAQGEFFEGILSFVLQVKAYFVMGVDVQFSLLCGLASATKAAVLFDFKSYVVSSVTLTGGAGDDAEDIQIPIITGRLSGFAAAPLSCFLLGLHRCLEMCSSVGCVVIFHMIAYKHFAVHFMGRLLSLAGPCFVAVQIILFLITSNILSTLAPEKHAAISALQLPLYPVLLPVPLLDPYMSNLAPCFVKGLSQVAVAATWYAQEGIPVPEGNEQSWHMLLAMTAAASCSMWLTLTTLRFYMAVTGQDAFEEPAKERASRMLDLLERRFQLRDGVVWPWQKDEHDHQWAHPAAKHFLEFLCERRERGWPAFIHECKQRPQEMQIIGDGLHSDCFGRILPLTLTNMTVDLRGNSSITDKAFEVLPPTLTSMTVHLQRNSTITDKAFEVLPRTLTSMTVNLQFNSTITDKAFEVLPRALTSMTVDLNGNSTITDKAFSVLPPTLTSMTVNLNNNSTITDKAFEVLAPTLTSMTVHLYSNSTITDKAFEVLPPTLTSMTVDLRGNSTITDKAFKLLPFTPSVYR